MHLHVRQLSETAKKQASLLGYACMTIKRRPQFKKDFQDSMVRFDVDRQRLHRHDVLVKIISPLN